MKKICLSISMALVAVLLLGTTALAGSEEISGTGTIWAVGAGHASVSGNGTLSILGREVGRVHVSGHDTLTASGRGMRINNPDGSVTFIGWKGQIQASGTTLDVDMTGGMIRFKASGSGQATLRGSGTYRVCHADQTCNKGSWSSSGAQVTFGSQ